MVTEQNFKETDMQEDNLVDIVDVAGIVENILSVYKQKEGEN